MRFVLGPIPVSDAVPSGWTPIQSSNELRWARVASVAGMLLLLIAGFLSLQQAAFASDAQPWLLVGVIASTILLIPLHEFFHCLGYWVSFRSRKLVTGIGPSSGVWYVVYDAPLPRWRVLTMLVAPLVSLSILPCLAFSFVTGSIAWSLAYLVLTQAGLCVGDMITFVRIWNHAPRNSLIHNHGWTTYWKMRPNMNTHQEQITMP